ncbi:hypothetical protein [Dongia rigui]|uniref:Uncharacterized protein n=1 Tax=Dongia rigui TaxID=940149 RepID=A0ABU5DYZ0_9PROT|nr:hypothetical protein [Dongia rigui]MDY0872501.1 hypothetical protein [Dongia rigui]
MEQKGNKDQSGHWVGLRNCLSCGGRFVALSPYVRVCDLCKAGEEWQSGNVDVVRHHPAPANDN